MKTKTVLFTLCTLLVSANTVAENRFFSTCTNTFRYISKNNPVARTCKSLAETYKLAQANKALAKNIRMSNRYQNNWKFRVQYKNTRLENALDLVDAMSPIAHFFQEKLVRESLEINNAMLQELHGKAYPKHNLDHYQRL